MIELLTNCLLPQQRETKAAKKQAKCRLRQSEVFFQLDNCASVASHVVPAGFYSGLI